MAARSGARVALAGGACGDGWGRRLRKRLREEGVDVPGVRVRVISTIGAGDVLTGILLGSFALSGFDPASVAASLPEAVEASARACERWAALE